MRANEFIAMEWRNSPYDPSTSQINAAEKLNNSTFITNINIESDPNSDEDIDHGSLDIVRYDYDPNNRLYMIVRSGNHINKWTPPILARMWISHIQNNVWQVKEIVSSQGSPIKNLGLLLVKNVLILERLKLINDFDMSTAAENLWMNKLSDRISGIYDNQLNQIYPLSSVGSMTSDGAEIIHPRDDKGDLEDYTGNSQRFFIILENQRNVNQIIEALYHKQEFRKKTNLNQSLSQNDLNWSRADIVKRIFDF